MTVLKTHQSEEKSLLSGFWSHLSQLIGDKRVAFDTSMSESYKKAMHYLPVIMQLSQSGNEQAQYYLSLFLRCQNKNTEADNWLYKSADQGYPDACIDIAQQKVIQHDYHSAETYLLKLIESGDSYLIAEIPTRVGNNVIKEHMPIISQYMDDEPSRHNKADMQQSLSVYNQSLRSSNGSIFFASSKERAKQESRVEDAVIANPMEM